MFEGNSIDGFWLGPWLLNKNPLGILFTWRRAQALMPTAFKTTIRERVQLEDASRAVQAYMDQMTVDVGVLEDRGPWTGRTGPKV